MKKKPITKSINNKTDLSGQNIIINNQWYVVMKTDEPKHLPNIKPLLSVNIEGTIQNNI